MTPLASFLKARFSKSLTLLILLIIYTLTMISMVVLIGRNPDPVPYLDIG